jgi:hypothetical protein
MNISTNSEHPGPRTPGGGKAVDQMHVEQYETGDFMFITDEILTC